MRKGATSLASKAKNKRVQRSIASSVISPSKSDASSDARPTRKRSAVNYRELNERGLRRGIKKEEEAEEEDDIDDIDESEAANDIAEVLDAATGTFSSVWQKPSPRARRKASQKKRTKRGSEDSEDSGDEENGVQEEGSAVAFTVPHRKFGKRRIAFPQQQQNLGPSPSKKNKIVDKEETYEECKDQICVACAKQLDPDKVDDLANIFMDTTTNGKSLHELFQSLVQQDVQPTSFGSRVCGRCLAALNGIESLYLQYRRAAETFTDAFVLGQKMLDADVIGAADIQSLAGPASYVSLSKAAVKIIDPTSSSFNALAVGYDFQVRVEKTYRISVLPKSEIPPGSAPVESEDGTVTLTFDQETGRIEEGVTLDSTEMGEHEVDHGRPTVYLAQNEFYALKKTVTKDTVYVQTEEFDSVASMLLLGHRIKPQFVLSRCVAEEYRRQIPGAKAQFTCSDCSTSFPYLNMLSNHIQSIHAVDDDDKEQDVESKMTVRDSSGSKGKCVRTGEVPTLEKPFQCETCDKCFSEYLTLSTHIDHYHGFSRQCNVENCSEVHTSIQDFVQHYVSHADLSFRVPADFQAKTKITLPCPMCSINIQGVWKYFHHTYIHDKEARFKCPICGKRTHKVQNFKDHLVKHNQDWKHGGGGSVPSSRGGRSGGGASAASLYCKDCGKSFTVPQKLEYHREMHIPKDEWSFACASCGASFPSETRLKLHVNSIHANVNTVCVLCDRVFHNRYEMQEHLQEQHESIIIIQE